MGGSAGEMPDVVTQVVVDLLKDFLAVFGVVHRADDRGASGVGLLLADGIQHVR